MSGNTQLTRRLLAGGILAGPIYITVGLGQILTRNGFDITRHPLSMLSLGDLGWIQITNFLVTGALVLLAAIAMHRLAGADKRLRRGALVLGLYGLCLISDGIFSTDPSLGFPPGTPNVYPETFSSHGLIHFIVGQVAFISLIVASFTYGKYFAVNKMRAWAKFSRTTAWVYLVAIIVPIPAAASMSTAALAASSIFLYAAVALGWVWLTALVARNRGMVQA